jgi:hypothetical protein
VRVSHVGWKRTRIARSALLVLASLLCACSAKPPMKVGWEYDPGARFVGLRSYAWVPGPQQRTGDPRVDDSWANKRVRRAIDKQLAAQGFVAASPEQADFWVGYHVLLLDKVQSSTTQRYYGYNRAWGGDAGLDLGWHLAGAPTTYSQRYNVGTLTVFIEAPATQRPIWQGFAQAQIEASDDIDTRDQRLEKAAVLILEKFPPASPSPQSTDPPGE